MFRTTRHDNSGQAIELILELHKWPCRQEAAGSRVDTKTSRHDDHSNGTKENRESFKSQNFASLIYSSTKELANKIFLLLFCP